MALDTYANLQASIAAWAKITNLTTEIPDFITIAENRAVRRLAQIGVHWLTKRAYATPQDDFIALPDDYTQMRALTWTTGGIEYPLQQLSVEQLKTAAPVKYSTPYKYYAIHDNQIELGFQPASDNDSDTLTTSYYYKPDNLSDSNTSNEILVNTPELLLFLSIVELFDYTKHYEKKDVFEKKAEAVFNEIEMTQENYDWSGPLVAVAEMTVF